MKIKRFLSLSLAIFTMFFMIDDVSAVSSVSFEASGLKSTIGVNIIKKGNLGYYVSDSYDNTAYEIENTMFGLSNYNSTHGSINIFGYDGDIVYESSRIATDPSDSSGSKKILTGIFPVFYVGNAETLDVTESQVDNYKYLLKTNNEILQGTDSASGLKVTVTPSHVLNDQFVKLTFVAENTSSSDKIISMAGYSDVALDGVDNASETPAENIVINAKGFEIKSKKDNTSKERKMYVITEDFVHVTNAQYWIGSRKSSTEKNEYSNAFKNSNKTFNTSSNNNDTGMAFSWNNVTVPANGKVTKSIIIGLGDEYKPGIDISGENEYNLDNVTKVETGINYVVPTDGNQYKLYYKLNDGNVNSIADADLTKAVSATKLLDFINDEDLNKCGENTLKAWIGPTTDSDFAKAIVSDEHKFTVTSASCIPEKQEDSPQTGVNTNYLILGLILVGGIGVYVYGRKHNKFPQV